MIEIHKCKHCKKEIKNNKYCSLKYYFKFSKKNKIGWRDSKLQSKLGKRGIEVNRKNSTGVFNPIVRSKAEKNAIINNRKNNVGKNYQVKVESKLYDFLIKNFKCFIEYHPWDRKFTEKEYYNLRRNNLNENRYKNYNLVIIK